MENTEKGIVQNNNQGRSTILPPVDIFEEKEGYTLFADMPGVSKENLELTLDNKELTILGKISETEEYGNSKYSEFTDMNFKRTFIVNDEIDTKNISAIMDNGILHLSLPKSEKTRPRIIEVKSV